MLWSKQYYLFDVDTWLKEHEAHPLVGAARAERRGTPSGSTCSTATSSPCPTSGSTPGTPRGTWRSTPLALALVDFDFAKEQLLLMLRSLYCPPERADPGLRVELQRREPARPRLGHALPLQDRAGPRARGHRVPGALVPRPDAQLQLVGEPQGPRGPQRLRRRLPGPRQHRRLRPERAAADRRLAGAGRRHGLDGLLLPEHDRDRAHPGRPRSAVRGVRLQVPPALHVDRLRDGPHRRPPRRDVGRGRTGSSTTSCACPTDRRRG